jgi:multimeric flavodoxin WrbA
MSNPRHVLAFVGSPRVGGNTDILVDEVLRGAEEGGAVTDKAYLGQSKIGPCHACDACADTGICIQRDDMDDLLKRMMQSDVWVLGTPVYWWGATAQFKLFLDRWYAPWHGVETKRIFENRQVVLVVTMGDSDPSTADPTLRMFERSLAYIGLELAATVLAPGVYKVGDALAHPNLIEHAREAGRTVVSI